MFSVLIILILSVNAINLFPETLLSAPLKYLLEPRLGDSYINQREFEHDTLRGFEIASSNAHRLGKSMQTMQVDDMKKTYHKSSLGGMFCLQISVSTTPSLLELGQKNCINGLITAGLMILDEGECPTEFSEQIYQKQKPIQGKNCDTPLVLQLVLKTKAKNWSPIKNFKGTERVPIDEGVNFAQDVEPELNSVFQQIQQDAQQKGEIRLSSIKQTTDPGTFHLFIKRKKVCVEFDLPATIDLDPCQGEKLEAEMAYVKKGRCPIVYGKAMPKKTKTKYKGCKDLAGNVIPPLEIDYVAKLKDKPAKPALQCIYVRQIDRYVSMMCDDNDNVMSSIYDNDQCGSDSMIVAAAFTSNQCITPHVGRKGGFGFKAICTNKVLDLSTCYGPDMDIADAFLYMEFQPSTCIPSHDMFSSWGLQPCSQTNEMNSQDFKVREYSGTNCVENDYIAQDNIHFPQSCFSIPTMNGKFVGLQLECRVDGETRVNACDVNTGEDLIGSMNSAADAKSMGIGLTTYVKPDTCITIDASKFGVEDLEFHGVFSACEDQSATLSTFGTPDCNQDQFDLAIPLDASGECGKNKARDVSFAVTCPAPGAQGTESLIKIEVCEAGTKGLVLKNSLFLPPQPESLMDYLPYAGIALLIGMVFSGVFYMACRNQVRKTETQNYSIRLDSHADTLIV